MKDWIWIYWYDWVLGAVYLYLIYLIFKAWSKNHVTDNLKKYFMHGLIAKFIGCIGFAVYHQYIFKGGDTILYFKTGVDMGHFVFSDFHRFLSLTFLPVESTIDLRFFTLDNVVFHEANFFISRIVSVLSLFTFFTYVPISLCFAALSYIGIWYCYTAIIQIYPNLKRQLAFCFLYIPSVVVWGSGLAKDSLTFGATCLVFGALVRLLLIPKPKLLYNIIYFSLGASIVLIVKPYILYSFILSFAIGIIFQKIVIIKNWGIKIILFPLIALIGIGITVLLFTYLNADKEFGLNVAAEKVLANNKNLNNTSMASSSYDLGIDIENVSSFSEILPVFPRSIFITLFRPFLWEVNGISMFFSAIESTCFLLLFIYVLFKRRLLGIFPILVKNPIAISCILFTIVFAGFVGISSGNFGTLVRYKIPCIPFFCMLLAILNNDYVKKAVDKPLHIL